MARCKSRRRAALYSSLLLAPMASAFYLPGVAPTTYKKGDKVPLLVNRLSPAPSRDGQIRSALTYDYYDPPFHFCQPQNEPRYVSESLGSIIFGDRIKTSPFELRMAVPDKCKAVAGCGPRKFEPVDAKFVNKRIWQNYHMNWLIDGLPAGQNFTDLSTNTQFVKPGFQLGRMENETPIFHNHYDIHIDYHVNAQSQYRVVGVLVNPSSNRYANDHGDTVGACDHPEKLVLSEKQATKVVFTYSVYWRKSGTPFATRWDKYLHVYDPNIHWAFLFISTFITILFSAMVFVILLRTLRKDISRYNKLNNFVLEDLSHANGNSHSAADDAIQEDSGWKLIHGDVFRQPKNPLLLSICVGNGVQLFTMTGFTIAFALFGFLSPSNRGSLGSAVLLLYTLFSSFGGYASSFVYKSLGGEDRWKQNILLTPVMLPGIVFGTFFLLNLFLWAKNSAGAVPFSTMLVIVLIWFIISVPLSFIGSWIAYKRPAVQSPVRTNQIPRQIPEAANLGGSGLVHVLQRPIPSLLLAGAIPFTAIFTELRFIMTSIWSNLVYYMFGFLFVCYGLMIVTCATGTVLMVYFILCTEDYRWQWRSFLMSGACGVYVFLYALVFWASRLSFGSSVSSVLYLGYALLISLLVSILTGAIGFLSSWIFVHRIYRSLKVD